MTEPIELVREAKALPKDERKRILASIPELQMHEDLAALFRAIEPDYWVEVTHGIDEYGKDLVIVRADPVSPDVIAVVVKRGNIKGKTAGDVDALKQRISAIRGARGDRLTQEILSQIRQSRSHAAELPTHIRRLTISKVLVVLLGELSKNARERIEAEVGSTGDVFDLSWAVDTFTQHYPQVFFEGRSVDFLDDLIKTHEKDSFYAKTGRTLSECFVEPLIARMDVPLSLNEDAIAVAIRNRRLSFSHLREVIQSKERLLITGDPGSGKSKALAKLCIDRYRDLLKQVVRSQDIAKRLLIPILVSARNLATIADIGAFRTIFLPDKVSDRFAVDTLMVDGLDEVPASQRHDLLKKAETFAWSLNARLVLTSRKIAMLNDPPPGFERFELLPFEFGQAIKLMQKLVTNPDMMPAIKEGLQRIQAQIPMSPLSLLLLVELVVQRKEIPSSLTELYDRFLDMVLGRWDYEKGLEVLFEYVVKKRFLAALAYREFQQKQRLEIPRVDYDNFVSSYAAEYGWNDESIHTFLREVERAGILEVQEDVFFRHRSFLDYSVAVYIHERRAEIPNLTGTIAQFYFDSIWSEVAFFYVGLSREISPGLLEVLFGDPGNDLPTHAGKLLIGRLLQAGWHSPTKVKEAGITGSLGSLSHVHLGFLAIFVGTKRPVAKIYGDIFAMLVSDLSFGSMFLSKEVRAILDRMEAEGSLEEDDLYRRLALIWASQRFSDSDVLDKDIGVLMGAMTQAKFNTETEARFLLACRVLRAHDGPMAKAIARRLERVIKRAPGVVRGLLPKPMKGFRKKRAT